MRDKVEMMDRCIDDLIKIETAINARPCGSVFTIQNDVTCPKDLKIAIWQTTEVFGAIDMAAFL